MSNETLSKQFVKDRLKDNVQISPLTDDKIEYFRDGIKKAHAIYRKEHKGHAKSLPDFAHSVLLRHSHKILKQSINFQKDYIKDPQYLAKLIKDAIKADQAKRDPEHIFTRDTFIDPIIMEFENLIDRRYRHFLKIETKDLSLNKKTLYKLVNRYFEQTISGLMLLEHELYNDSFILWRSLLETTGNLLILSRNPKIIGKFTERQQNALRRINIKDTSRENMVAKSKESQIHLGTKNVPFYVAERFGWAGELLKAQGSGDYSQKVLLEIAKIENLSVHYTFASLFVHEYLIDSENLPTQIEFDKYLLTLYFKIYELVRVIISDEFTNDLDDARKLEKGIRDEVSNYKGKFNDFALKIQGYEK